MKKVLGISAFYHDSAAALVIGGRIIAAAQEERFTRDKHTPDFPVQAVKYCLEEAGLEIDDLDAIVFYDKPLLKFERLLQTYYSFSPKGLISFLKAIPVWSAFSAPRIEPCVKRNSRSTNSAESGNPIFRIAFGSKVRCNKAVRYS